MGRRRAPGHSQRVLDDLGGLVEWIHRNDGVGCKFPLCPPGQTVAWLIVPGKPPSSNSLKKASCDTMPIGSA
jgi:hypothetical protein